jgi:hypothetical protein
VPALKGGDGKQIDVNGGSTTMHDYTAVHVQRCSNNDGYMV